MASNPPAGAGRRDPIRIRFHCGGRARGRKSHRPPRIRRAPMTLRAWRIVKAKHAATAFSGDGAKKFGGRWNSPGIPAIYLAGSTSLAILEMLVHLQSQEL